MFLRSEETNSDSLNIQDQLRKKLKALSQELDQSLELIGMSRDDLDKLTQDSSQFAGVDWLVIDRELKEFRQTLDLICFGQGAEQLKQRRDEMRQRGQWISSK